MNQFLCGTAILLMLAARAHAEVDFNRDIRPILSDNCFVCHGPNEADRESDLRLDNRSSAVAEAESGQRALVPGDPEASELFVRITSQDDGERMPPPETDKSLSSEQIDLIRQWIDSGASWKDHWSFIVPEKIALPNVKQDAWPINPIDHFILKRLESEGLSPSAPADRATLLRRVTLDLTGLPPSPAELGAFLSDTSDHAYEDVVDRLLDSDRYGEHMARFWLDAARYGDTHGLHLDNYREMWPYRDWVVRAFNQNLSYDRFTTEQLAGDLLSDPTRDQLIATGFNRAHVTTSEGGSIADEVHVRNVVDRVVTVGTVFMGMTFECTRCHDHKYDPFTMDDFYSMFAFFNSIDGNPLDGNRADHAPVLRVPTERQEAELAKLSRDIATFEAKLNSPWPEVDGRQRIWEDEITASATAAGTDESGAQSVITLGDWYTIGPFSDTRNYLLSRKHGPEGNAINLEQTFRLGPTDKSISWVAKPEWRDGRPHRALPGEIAANFVYRLIESPDKRQIAVSLGSGDAVKVYLNGKQVFRKDEERSVAADQEQIDLMLQAGDNHLLMKIINFGGDSGFYFATDSPQVEIPENLLQIVLAGAERSTEDAEKVRSFFRNKVAEEAELTDTQNKLERVRSRWAEVDRQVATTLIWREANEAKPAYYLKRGEYDQRGDTVGRRTPQSLPPMPDELPKNRLGLAKWLTDPAHPLTARVAVNRFWQQLFGTGIVKTADDFGSQGEPPSHSELLDWLAAEFITDGWDVKNTMRRIVTSATYRQSSRTAPDVYEKDPENRLLARGPRFRLDAEMLRDQAITLGGLLVEQLGGPSVKPPQPDGLWFAVGYSGSNTVKFVADKGRDKVHRRTLYTFIKRTAPPPQMSIVDAPSREACVVRRERTNTPLLSLLLFNDPQYVEAARAMGERTMREGGSTIASRATYMFRLATCRYPSSLELDDLVRGFQQDLAEYSVAGDQATKLLQIGEVPPDSSLDKSELAAWTMTANMLLNLDEVVTKN